MMFPKPEKPVRGTTAARAHMAKVAAQTCVVCSFWPTVVHHCIHGRGSQSRASDFDTIPLCDRCHRELHANPTEWRDRNGPDFSYLPLVRAAIRLTEDRTV